MDLLAAAFWGGFFTVAAFMFACAIVAAVRGFRRMAAVAATFSIVPSLFVAAYIGLLPAGGMRIRLLGLIAVAGAAGLTWQLLLVLRGYKRPVSDRRLRRVLLASAGAVLAASWAVSPSTGLWLAHGYAFATGLTLIVLAVRKALRGAGVAWLSVVGVSLSLVSLGSLGWIAAHPGAVPLAVHATAAVSSMLYIAIMGGALWMRYADALELKQVLAQGPSFDPVTRLPSHAHAGKLVGSFLRLGSGAPLGVIAVSLANLQSLEHLHGRAAYNHALYVCATRLRRGAPMGAKLGRLGEDGFLVLLPTDDLELLKHVAAKVHAALVQPIEVGADPDAPEVEATSEWVADAGLGITLRRPGDSAGSAVATARATSRAAFATASRIVCSDAGDLPPPVSRLRA